MSDITMQQARAAVDAARRRSDELSVKMNIAVVDAGTNLKAFARMDGAWLGSIDIAIKKARTARMFDMDTGAIGALSQPGGSLYNIEHSNDGLITFPGGVPIKNSAGEIIGAGRSTRPAQAIGSNIHSGSAHRDWSGSTIRTTPGDIRGNCTTTSTSRSYNGWKR